MEVSVAHQILLVVSGLFAGGIVMEGFVEQPARLASDAHSAIKNMQEVLKRADPYMPILAVIGFVSGLISFFYIGSVTDVIAGTLMGMTVPWTIATILPINKRVSAFDLEAQDPATLMPAMRRWLNCHYFRVVVSVSALLVLSFGA